MSNQQTTEPKAADTAAESSAIHYAHVPWRAHEWMSCAKCGTGFAGKTLVHFYEDHDYNRVVCGDCALRLGFNIFCEYGPWEIGHDTAHCQIGADGEIETWVLDDDGKIAHLL
jgi:hypothetical protein